MPGSILDTPEWEAGWAAYDTNGATNLRVHDRSDTPGHLGTWVWNVTDDTPNH